jgi:hypothetical protein
MMPMPSTEIDRRVRVNAAARKDHVLIARAAKRMKLAGTALASAAWDLDNAHDRHGNALTALAEVVRDEAGRLSHLVEDIASHKDAPDDGE